MVATNAVVAGMGSVCGSGSGTCDIDIGVVAASPVGDESVTGVVFDVVDAAVVNDTGSGLGAGSGA